MWPATKEVKVRRFCSERESGIFNSHLFVPYLQYNSMPIVEEDTNVSQRKNQTGQETKKMTMLARKLDE